MADNTTQYGNATIAADDVGGVLHQRVKVSHGVDGQAVDASAVNPFPTSPDNFSSWRDEMTGSPSAMWTVTASGGALSAIDGNAAGASYLKLTLDPRNPDSRVDVVGKRGLAVPCRVGLGITLSRRSVFQHGWVGITSVDGAGAPITDGVPAPTLTLSGGLVATGSAVTATTTVPHGYVVGTRVAVVCSDARASNLYTVASVPSPTTWTAASSLGALTYGTGGTCVEVAAALDQVDCVGVIVDDGTFGNAKVVTRAGGASRYVRSWNPGSTWDQSVVPNNLVNYAADYTNAHQPRYTLETLHEGDWAAVLLHGMDSSGGVTSQLPVDQQIPDTAATYAPRLQWRNLPFLQVPRSITAISKAGSTTATVTSPGHGLITGDVVTLYGVRDQTGFANQTTGVAVTVVDANTLTLAFGASTTATSYGGSIFRAEANTAPQIISGSSVQSIAASGTRLLVQFLASQGAWTVGESVCLTGVVDSTNTPQTAYEGLYRVARSNTTTFQAELEPLQGQALPGATVTCGGLLLPAPDMRVHFGRGRTHGRVGVEIESSRGHGRSISAVPVNITTAIPGTSTVNVGQVGGSTAANLVTAAGTNRGPLVALGAGANSTDKSSSAVGSSTNSGTIGDDAGQAIAGLVRVSAVSGTGPTMDVILQESYDNGTTWQDAYHLPRITAAGNYPIPPMQLHGRRRWAYTIAGTSPSFTFDIITMRASIAPGLERQWFDRSLNPNAVSNGASQYIEGCGNAVLVVASAAGATTHPVCGVQLSLDGTNWWDSGISLTCPPSQTVASAITVPGGARYARPVVKTAGVAAAFTYAAISAASC